MPFFVSLGLGYRKIAITADLSTFKIEGESLATSATLNLGTLYFGPSVGWEFDLSRKLSLGVELGLQLTLVAGGSLYLEDSKTGANSDDSEVLRTNSSAAMGRIASLPLPKVTLFRLTYHLD